MTDRILRAFLERQRNEGMALAAASDLLDLLPLGGDPPRHYLANFRCTGLIKTASGEITEANDFMIGIWFPDSYLRSADPFTVLTVLEPAELWHANARAPLICIGPITAGCALIDILYRCWELLTYRRLNLYEPLAPDAAAWARSNLHRFPTDRRQLKRRARDAAGDDFDVVEVPS